MCIALFAFSFPLLLHAQVIRITGGANMVVTGEAKIILQDGSFANHGSIGAAARSTVFTGYTDKAGLAAKKLPVAGNIMVGKSFGRAWPAGDNVYIFLGKEAALYKRAGALTFMQAWPNPVTKRFTLTVSSDKAATGVIALQDESGRILERRRINYAIGLNTIQWDLANYAAGPYLLVFENVPGKYLKIVKQ